MAEESAVEGMALVRPLLGVARKTLHRIADESGLPIADDPSNGDLRFDRVRMRRALPDLAALGLTPRRLAETAARLGRAADALDHYATALMAEHFTPDPFGVVTGARAALAAVPEEVALRALALIVKAVGGADYTPRLESVEALLAALLAEGPETRIKRTLGGVMLARRGETLTARREWGRAGPADAAAPAGSTLIWDRRFAVAVPLLSGALRVGALARSDRRFRARGVSRNAVDALPGLYRDGALVAVPELVEPADAGATLARLKTACVVGSRLGMAPEPRLLGG
jgi:tRNA(Ile)-lysidine synthase